MRRYDAAGNCGKWNARVVEDFRSDLEFIRKADELYANVVSQQTNGETVTSDGLALETVTIDFATSIDLHFRLSFLDGPNGYGMAPARLSVATRDHCTRGTLCCGLSGRDGNFWYPTTKRISNVVMPDDYDWAYSRTRVIGPQTISSWIDRRTQNPGEQ